MAVAEVDLADHWAHTEPATPPLQATIPTHKPHSLVQSVAEEVQEARDLRPLSLVEMKWIEELSTHYAQRYQKPADYYQTISEDTVVLTRVGKGADAVRRDSLFVYDLLEGGVHSHWLDNEADNARLAKEPWVMAKNAFETIQQSYQAPVAA